MKNLQILLDEAHDAYRNGDFAEAQLKYRSLIESKRSGEAAAALGALLRKTNQEQEAGRLYGWAIKNCEWTPILIYNACNWLIDHHKAKESLTLVAQGLQKWPENVYLRWRQVLSLHHLGETRKAILKIEELIIEEGERPLLLEELASCLTSCQRYIEALEIVKKLRQKIRFR